MSAPVATSLPTLRYAKTVSASLKAFRHSRRRVIAVEWASRCRSGSAALAARTACLAAALELWSAPSRMTPDYIRHVACCKPWCCARRKDARRVVNTVGAQESQGGREGRRKGWRWARWSRAPGVGRRTAFFARRATSAARRLPATGLLEVLRRLFPQPRRLPARRKGGSPAGQPRPPGAGLERQRGPSCRAA